MTQLATVTAGAGADTVVNQNLRALSPSGLYGIRQAGTAGLVLGYYGGSFNGVDVSDGTVTLTASAINYVVAHKTTGVVTAATNTTNWLDASTYMQLYQFVAGSASFTIANNSDKRQTYGSSSGAAFTGGTLTSALNEAPAVTIASSGTVNIGAAAANTINVTGTLNISAFDSIAASATRRLIFGGILTLTHNATSLILPTGSNITTAAGDVAEFVSLGSGNWRCVSYMRASGAAVAGAGGTLSQIVNAQTGTTYTYLTGDNNKLVTHSNAASIAGTLPQAGASFPSGWWMDVQNRGAGTLTITPATSTIDGAASVALTTGQGLRLVSDGTNYFTQRGAAAGGGGGGLTNFTESINTASPNNTISAAQLIATGAASNIDFVVSPKGTAATQSQVADSTATGGNKRGTFAIDWQRTRAAATQVASGSYSVIFSGRNNTASALTSAITHGDGNTASNQAAIAGGEGSTASGLVSFAIGKNLTVSGDYAFASGRGGIADAESSNASGYNAVVRTVYGAQAWASGSFSSAGDAQARRFILRAATTNATPTRATSNAAAAAATNQIVLPSNSTVKFRAEVVARQASNGDSASWTVVGLIKNISGTVSLVGTPTVTMDFNDAGAASWVLAVTADNTNKTVAFDVTGVAATNLKFVVSPQTVEVAG